MPFAIRNVSMITFGGVINKHLYMKTTICSNESKGELFFKLKIVFPIANFTKTNVFSFVAKNCQKTTLDVNLRATNFF